jgi:hypothetical protein
MRRAHKKNAKDAVSRIVSPTLIEVLKRQRDILKKL